MLDDPTRLRRSLKKDEKAKQKRKAAWQERSGQQAAQQAERQKKCTLCPVDRLQSCCCALGVRYMQWFAARGRRPSKILAANGVADSEGSAAYLRRAHLTCVQRCCSSGQR